MTTDHLGSTRVVTGRDQSVKGRYDYLPFGEALGAGMRGRTPQLGYDPQTGLRQNFTSKEREVESGLDYFGMRYYGSTHGRFTSIDPLLETGDPADPQSWNRYTYTFNNPLKYIDPTGGFVVPAALTAALANQQEKRNSPIKFEVLGQVKILGRDVTVYAAAGQTKEYRDTVFQNAQAAAEYINSKADRLSSTDRKTIGNITAIAALGADVTYDEIVAIDGKTIKGYVGSSTNEGIDTISGVYFTASIQDRSVENFATSIGHEGKHREDALTRRGAYAPSPDGGIRKDFNDLNERRAFRYQLSLYRKLSGSTQQHPDHFDRELQKAIKNPHKAPAFK